MVAGNDIISLVARRQDLDQFRRKNWEGTFAEYLDIVREQPRVARNAFERVYDMILSYGVEEDDSSRDRRTRYSLMLVLWVALAGNVVEVGENYRFRFLVGPLCAALAAVGWPKRRRA